MPASNIPNISDLGRMPNGLISLVCPAFGATEIWLAGVDSPDVGVRVFQPRLGYAAGKGNAKSAIALRRSKPHPDVWARRHTNPAYATGPALN
jgi:hypothetical protein